MTLAPSSHPALTRDARSWPVLPERNGYEMVEGRWERMAMGNKSLHAAGNITHRLWLFTQTDGGLLLLNESSIQIWPDSPSTYRKPDGMYFAPGRLPGDIVPDEHIHVVPDLVIEGISKNEKGEDILLKTVAYLEAGVRLVWAVYPQTRVVMVYRPARSVSWLSLGDVLSGEDVIPGFSVSVDQIFASV